MKILVQNPSKLKHEAETSVEEIDIDSMGIICDCCDGSDEFPVGFVRDTTPNGFFYQLSLYLDPKRLENRYHSCFI
ncbi:hypothetical protein BLOT_012701 [Blomia tropicalis]|nr:hypothetical protein BLOT_012701 [Blomia tropicalis]